MMHRTNRLSVTWLTYFVLAGILVPCVHSQTPTNQAPLVNAGPDQTITLPDTVALKGAVTDDGLPVGETVTTTWAMLSGPGSAAFDNPDAAETVVVFSDTGTYVLQFIASDGELLNSDEITVIVKERQANRAPQVSAGPDQRIMLPDTAALNGTVTDDGLPAESTLTSTWTKLSGPGDTTFADPAARNTTVTFSLAGTYVLRLTATDGALSNSADITVDVNTPSSANLIAKALAAGTITKEQAVVYELYANFKDSRLPEQFRGDDVGIVEGRAYDHAIQYLAATDKASIPAETVQALRPFFLAPHEVGSWWQLKAAGVVTTFGAQPGSVPGGTVDSPTQRDAVSQDDQGTPGATQLPVNGWVPIEGTNVIVWCQEANAQFDHTVATRLVSEIETRIWPKLTTLMGRKPLPDTGFKNEILEIEGDKDPRLDVFLDDLTPIHGTTLPLGNKLKAARVRIFLNSLATKQQTLTTAALEQWMRETLSSAAHEMMHAIQFSIEVKAEELHDYTTIVDATASWAQHYVYPEIRVESRRAKFYLENLPHSYDSPPEIVKKQFPYGAYLFPLFLEQRFGAAIIKRIWDATVPLDDELLAIEQALRGVGSTFSKEWPKFIAANWNQQTLNMYRQFGVTAIPQPKTDRELLLTNGFGEVKHDVRLPHASFDYHRVVLSAPARSVVFVNGLSFVHKIDKGIGTSLLFTGMGLPDRHGVSMQVYLKVNGVWQSDAIDLSEVHAVDVCRDDPEGKIEEVIFMYGNAEIEKGQPNYEVLIPKALSPGVIATDIGCRDWTGNVSQVTLFDGGRSTFDIRDARFKNEQITRAPLPSDTFPPYGFKPGEEGTMPMGYEYKVVSGTATWSHDYKDEDCTARGFQEFPIVSGAVPLPYPMMDLPNWTPPGSGYRTVTVLEGFFSPQQQRTWPKLVVVGTCKDGSNSTFEFEAYGALAFRGFVWGRNTLGEAILRVKGGGLSIAETAKPYDGFSISWSFTGSTN